MHHRRDMALREFTDRMGCRWRVWDIRPEEVLAMAQTDEGRPTLLDGWIAFEARDGGAKRRLSPIPARWEYATDAELDRMLERAEPVGHEAGSTEGRDGTVPGP